SKGIATLSIRALITSALFFAMVETCPTSKGIATFYHHVIPPMVFFVETCPTSKGIATILYTVLCGDTPLVETCPTSKGIAT
ncbi:MAG: hypothetical protein PWP26_1593, partial [Thermodesulfobacterium sp.]|nr:hypothetical protein [Thermodesulfobacterium sp.]